MSGGEQQRVALAKMLLRKPDLLVLDEPTKGLDACFKRKLATILKSLQKNGMTVLMVTHDIEFCAEYADICAMFLTVRLSVKLLRESSLRKIIFIFGKTLRSIIKKCCIRQRHNKSIGG